jgi:hypothetical protein
MLQKREQAPKCGTNEERTNSPTSTLEYLADTAIGTVEISLAVSRSRKTFTSSTGINSVPAILFGFVLLG